MPRADRDIVEIKGDRVAIWLRRIYPRNGAKLAAQDFHVSPHTSRRWFEGKLAENKHLAAMEVRWGQPFVAFVTEPLVGAWRTPDASTTAESKPVRDLINQVLDEVGARERFLWCTGDGKIEEAPAGHDEMARRAMGAPAHLDMDFSQYMRRNHGWVAMTRPADGSVIIHYAERRLRAATVEAICRWLHSERRPTLITRIVDLGLTEVRVRHRDRASAALALEEAAMITMRGTSRSWVVQRLPIDAARNFGFAKLLKAWGESPNDIVAAAAALDGFKHTSVFRLDQSGELWSLIVGSSFGLPAQKLEGRRVMERGDTGYAAMIADRLNRSLTEPTLHELVGSVVGVPCRYQNLSMPELGTGRIVSASRVVEPA